MKVEELLKPISADAPCGEDLLAVDDPDFVDYYFNVEERLPTSYFNVLRGTLFDPKSVDHKALPRLCWAWRPCWKPTPPM